MHGPLGYAKDVRRRVNEKLGREPIEDLRIDFEDGYGVRDDAEEDAAARAAGELAGRLPVPFVGLRCKSLEAPTRRRAVRTLRVFLDALGTLPPGFVVTLPKVSAVEQVARDGRPVWTPRRRSEVRDPDRDAAGRPRRRRHGDASPA